MNFSFSVTIKASAGMDIFHPVLLTYSTDSEWNRKRIQYFASTSTLLPLLPSFGGPTIHKDGIKLLTNGAVSTYLDKVMTLSIAGAVKVEGREGQLDVVASFQCDDVDTVQVVRVGVGRFSGDNRSASAREIPPAFC